MSAVDADRGPYGGGHSTPDQPGTAGAYLLSCAALILAYPLLSDVQQMIAFLVVSLSSLAGVLVGLGRTAGSDRVPWWLLFFALANLNADNVIWYWFVFGEHRSTGDSMITNAFAAVGQVLMFSAAINVVSRRGRNDSGGMIDATIVSIAVGGVLWGYLLSPHMRAVGRDAVTQVSTCVAVFMLMGILGALTRLLLTAKRFVPALWLLVIAQASSLSGIIAVSMLIDPVTGIRPGWTNMLYMCGYAALGLFGLERSAADLFRPEPAPRDHLSYARLTFLGLAVAAMPITGAVSQALGRDVEGPFLAAVAGLVTPLVMMRIWRVSAERSWAEWTLRYQAGRDDLTGLPNRREFASRLATALREGRALAVIFCDLDGFKGVNDRLGHAAGDHLLVEVASRLRRCVRPGDVVSRFGGDEFVLLCLDAHREAAAQVCRRIEQALGQPVTLDGEPVVVGASIGAVTGDGAANAEEIIHRADAAMYVAKQSRSAEPGVRTVTA
ncbi:diguanylate cyclase domain-containing protein [Planosporangium sp. 12N6]|uniref:diguanylate cyclase domain-containing protein n=1 Tax=Planosporangium spinosum TaxID=3402278 RepID=UPI003CF9BDA9